MIQGIDIFQPSENGLPDFSKISAGQIFNGSVAASLNQIKDPYGLLKDDNSGTADKGYKHTPPAPTAPSAAQMILNARARTPFQVDSATQAGGGRRAPRRSTGGYTAPQDYSAPQDYPASPGDYTTDGLPTPDMPGAPETPGSNVLLDAQPLPPAPEWHAPMLPPADYTPPVDAIGTPLLFPPELTPDELKQAKLQRMPRLLLEELKGLSLV